VYELDRRLKVAVLAVAVILICSVVSFVTVIRVIGQSDKFFPGIRVKEVELGNKSREEALQVLEDYVSSLHEKTVKVNFQGITGSFKMGDVGVQINKEEILEKAWSVGRTGSYLEQWRERRKVARYGKNIPLTTSISAKKLQGVLESITKEVRVKPKDAEILITDDDRVEIIESVYGTGIDINDAIHKLKRIIEEDVEPEIELKIVHIKPSKTTEDIKKLRINGMIAKFTTSFDIDKVNRVFNIKVAAAALDEKLVKPGEEFSFNEVVGPRSQESGYKMAPTILNNEFVDSLGGGVCQVSSTLYNALILADLNITQRSNHSLTVGYVPLGQDAAVSYGGKDLKFKNNLPCSIIIKALVSGDTLTIKLFGDVTFKKSVKVVNSIIKEYPFKIVYKDDPTLPEGKEVIKNKGSKGYRVTSKLVVYQNGKIIKTKTLPQSYYKPRDQVVLVGTGPPEPNREDAQNTQNGSVMEQSEAPLILPDPDVPAPPPPAPVIPE